MSASRITLERVTKVYDGGVVAVDDVSLEVAAGEFVVLVGPSGCGKSTLLRMIAGLEKVTAGTVRIGERDVTTVAPPDRDIAMVFQNYALYPHKTVRENLAFGLRQRQDAARGDRAARRRDGGDARARGAAWPASPAQLSGGQRQRVAMGRALVREPRAFLLDEPLSNLDAKLRTTMRAELARLHERLGVTTVYVTHDQVEAMTLGERVAVLRDGVLQQFDVPQELFEQPVNLFVGGVHRLAGDEPRRARACDGERVRFAGHALPLPPARGRARATSCLGMRPGAFELDGPADRPVLPRIEVDGRPGRAAGRGGARARSASTRRRSRPTRSRPRSTTSTRGACSPTTASRASRARCAGRATCGPASGSTLAVDHRELHLFDPADGRGAAALSRPRRAGPGQVVPPPALACPSREAHADQSAVVGLVALHQAGGRVDRGVQDIVAVGDAGDFDVLARQEPVVFVRPADRHALLEVVEPAAGGPGARQSGAG